MEVGSEAAGDKDDGEPPPCSVRASWRRRELEDTREDEAELFQGQVASGRGLGGTDLAEARCGRRRAAKGSDGGAAGHQGCLACSGEKGSAWRGSVVWAKPGARRGGSGAARAKRVLCSRPEHARDVLDEMPGHARGLG